MCLRDSHVYVSNSSNIQLTILTNSGEWNYNTWSYDTVELTEAETLAKRNELEEWMKQYNLLPDGMIFSVQDGSIPYHGLKLFIKPRHIHFH